MDKKIVGCVILFNPEESVLENIKSYYNELEFLIIIDNSPVQNEGLIDRIKMLYDKIEYRWLMQNEGIAKALNTACCIATEQHAEWLLTMDQDSNFEQGDLAVMVSKIDKIEAVYGDAGIVCCFQNVNNRFISRSDDELIKISSTMTSGNLLKIAAYVKAGPFEEKLFVDYVDHEYCLRLRKRGFSIVQVNGIYLNHSLGKFEVKRFLGKEVGISNHNSVRRYYITRNGLYTVKKYLTYDTRFCCFIVASMLNDFFRILFFESEKYRKLKAIAKGVYHFFIGKYGVYTS